MANEGYPIDVGNVLGNKLAEWLKLKFSSIAFSPKTLDISI